MPAEVESALNRLNSLIEKFEQHPDLAVQARVTELLQCVDTIHRAGLRQLAQRLQSLGIEQQTFEAPEVRLLFYLYDLAEGGEFEREHLSPGSAASPRGPSPKVSFVPLSSLTQSQPGAKR